MNKLLMLFMGVLFLTGCPNEKEIKETTEVLEHKKNMAQEVINSKDFSLDGLLKAHDYFFDFNEKILLMKEDENVRKNIKLFIKNKGIKSFCRKFIIQIKTWETIDSFCQNENGYKCSIDIKEYPNTQKKFLELIGPDTAKLFSNEKECN